MAILLQKRESFDLSTGILIKSISKNDAPQ